MKALTLILTFCIIFADAAISQARQSATQSQLLADNSFKPINSMPLEQNSSTNCVYSTTIITSCNSPPSTKDNISLTFSDADGNRLYVERLDDPASGRFNQCSTDKLEISAPKCINQICYFALVRYGEDGWMPETATISGPNNPLPLKITYNTFLPQGVWYGINQC